MISKYILKTKENHKLDTVVNLKRLKVKTRSAKCQEVKFALDLVSGGNHCCFLIRREKWVGQDDLKRDTSLLAKRPTRRLCCKGMACNQNVSYYSLGSEGGSTYF